MTLVDFYTNFLKSVGFAITNEGWVMLPIIKDGSYQNALLDNKPLCIPTDKFIELNVWDDKVPYHPMCEDIHQGQSITIQYTVRAVKLAIMANTVTLMKQLLSIAKSTTLQNEIANPKLAGIIEPFGEVNDSIIKHWNAVEKKLGNNFLNLYIKANAARTVNKEPVVHLRAALLEVPILEPLDDDSAILCGVKVGKSNKTMFKEALKSLIPVTEVYSVFEEGPSFEVLIKLYYEIAKHQLAIFKVIEKVYPIERHIDISWGKHIDKLPNMRFEINTLPYNLGTNKSARIAEAEEEKKLADKEDYLSRGVTAIEDTPPFVPDEPKAAAKDPEVRNRGGDINEFLKNVNSSSRRRSDREYDNGRSRSRDDDDDEYLDDYDSRRSRRRERARGYLDDRDDYDDRRSRRRDRDDYDDRRGRDRDRDSDSFNDWLRRKDGRR